MKHVEHHVDRDCASRRGKPTAAAISMLLVVTIAPRMATADVPPNTLSPAEERLGWRLLFDGESLAGFRGYRRNEPGEGWSVDDGAIVRGAAEAPFGDLLSCDEFGSFELQLEYRISSNGNSGVMFHVTENEDQPWKSGPEVQVLDNASSQKSQKSGWLYDLYRPPIPDWNAAVRERSGLIKGDDFDATRPVGEWNHLYLRVTPQVGEVCVNGVRYYTFTLGSEDWNARVAKSRFASLQGFATAGRGHICLQDHGDEVAFRSIKIRELPDGEATRPVAARMAAKTEPAFPGITWEGWSGSMADGKPVQPLRPLLVTHAGDATGRRFVLDQGGMIHVVPATGATGAKLFLDIRERTAPWPAASEEGLLGLAFHPNFVDNGEFFICYSVKPVDDPAVRRQNLSRFRVQANDPDRADPASEEVLMTFEQPFANHNGGSITFGDEGLLYVGLGDGGSAHDPLGNGQNLSTWNGSILRIDVDHRDEGLAYGIPRDNPFLEVPGARPEIFALGFRNVWQISCDRPTGRIWAADVGQDLWEEVNIIERGGNYGWSIREGTQPFGASTAAVSTVDPVWVYDHREGKSITGGHVYRGGEIPELEGRYVFGDYVSGKVWALRFDPKDGRADIGEIAWNGLPVYGFGMDETGEMYVTTASPTGEGVFRIIRDEAVVPVGINDDFLDPALDPNEWLQRFEVESREVFSARHAILSALGLAPGDRIADVGSGTGLYLSAFSRAVGPEGRVYAVDISPRFVEFIQRRVQDEKLENVRVVQSSERSASLPPSSVDHAFICDSYHHFEDYGAMLASIRDALEPGGELVVIDFERIPGVSREWLLTHVRGGKETVRSEIEQAGFEFLGEVEVPQFRENYLLRFRRPGGGDGAAAVDRWAHWRGPLGTGAAPSATPPTEFGVGSGDPKNVRWKVQVPGRGTSSPVVWDDRVFVTTAVPLDDGRTWSFRLFCFDRETGRERWSRIAVEAVPHEDAHPSHGFASASPCTDGERVYAHFGSRGLFCYTLDGEPVWDRDFGDMTIRRAFGEGSSPTLVDDMLLVPWDHEGPSMLYAVDKRTGMSIWETPRNEPTGWATPLVAVAKSGQRQVVMNGQNAARGYDLSTGRELWRCAGQTQRPCPSAVAVDGVAYVCSGHRGAFIGAFDLDGRGDLAGGQDVAWSRDQDTPDVASPLLSDGRIYYYKQRSGLLTCVDAGTGEPLYEVQRVPGIGSTYASPIAAGGHVYLTDRSGAITVIEDGPQFVVVATNDVGEGVDATPAADGSDLIIRGERHLFRVSDR